ncbi:MAG TPA: Bax inhibitor-1/YccA family protein [Candidatus Eremiobacteraeota bacterium]|nr:Bax inhibitor-1/YccA family protein [Candidatus Eremiobacteraeota bacterium]
MTISSIALSQIELEERSFITKVYGWMAFALIITGLVAFFTASNKIMLTILFKTPLLFWGLILIELLLVGFLSAAVQNMSLPVATGVFILYSAINGLTLSVIFLVYTMDSIASTFFITAATFGIMSLYGYFTKTDLTTIGNLCFMALIGLIIASIVNIFFSNPILYWATTYIGILIFVGLTAYDTQKIKKLNIIGNEGTDEDKKEAIIGALVLYLDFINLFLLLLRIFGVRRRN